MLSVWLEEANLKLVAVHTASCNYELVPESRGQDVVAVPLPVPPEGSRPGRKGVIAAFMLPGRVLTLPFLFVMCVFRQEMLGV